MSKQIEALKLALEALEYIHEGANNQGPHTGISWRCVSKKAEPAIAAIREALADSALDRMAENARDLGLDYEPAQQEPVELDPKDVHVEVVTKQMGGFAPVMTNGIRLTHKPTGTVVEETAERSAHRNRDVAWKRLTQLVTSPKPAQPTQQQEPVATVTSETGADMNDRELLEKAAKAAAIEGYKFMIGAYAKSDAVGLHIRNYGTSNQRVWNPLTDDGDALRLAVELNIVIWECAQYDRAMAEVRYGAARGEYWEPVDDDKYAATRRAIVRAAAEIGKEMK